MICHDFLMKNVAFCIEKMIKIVSIFSWSKLSGFGRSKFWLYLNNRKLITRTLRCGHPHLGPTESGLVFLLLTTVIHNPRQKKHHQLRMRTRCHHRQAPTEMSDLNLGNFYNLEFIFLTFQSLSLTIYGIATIAIYMIQSNLY